MPGRAVMLDGDLAVVWRVTKDSSVEKPERLYDMTKDYTLLMDFRMIINVDDETTWIVDTTPEEVIRITLFDTDDRCDFWDVPVALEEAYKPPESVPINVWARAVLEAHTRICTNRYECRECTDTWNHVAANLLD